MATFVFFHAHPDDECIQTGGTMAKVAADGHRVVLVLATRGELGEVPDGFLDEGEQLGLRRIAETYASADVVCGMHPTSGMAPFVQAGLYNPKRAARATVSLAKTVASPILPITRGRMPSGSRQAIIRLVVMQISE